MSLRFWKYEGAGNDFVMLRDVEVTDGHVRALCDRHRGVGADGVIVLGRAAGWDFGMEYWNADGSAADMCGNGGRCAALFACDLGVAGRSMRFLGRDGEHGARVLAGGAVELGLRDVRDVKRVGEGYSMDTGVPHYVEFVDDLEGVDVCVRGRELRFDGRFGKYGANVNFAQVRDGVVWVRTYERGVEDETLACGTGATAAAVAVFLETGRRLPVRVRGGELLVGFDDDLRGVTLTGPARRVFEGRMEL